MLVIKTHLGKSREPQWVNGEINGKKFRIMAKLGDTKNSKGSALLVIDSDQDFQFHREEYNPENDNRGNR